MNKVTLAKNIIIFSICAILLYYVITLFQIGAFFCYVFNLFFPLIIALFFHFLLDPLIDYFTNDPYLSILIIVICDRMLFCCSLYFGTMFKIL